VTQHVPALIVGGGISGLVCAHALRRSGLDAIVIEASAREGGMIRSLRRNGYLLECGPQSFSGSASVLALCGELGLDREIVEAPASAPRYVLIDGKLRLVPMSPLAFLMSDLVSFQTKWTIIRDLLGKTMPPEPDESIAAFVRRKFSTELLDRLVGPYVSGVYAGDPERLSLRNAFPMLYEAEKRKGSVIRGGLSRVDKQQPRRRPTLLSFREGAETLVRAIGARLGSALRVGAEVTALARDSADASGAFQVTIRSLGREETLLADKVVLATPTDVAGRILCTVDSRFESLLAEIEYAPVAVVSLGYPRSDVGHDLNGFGFLVPRTAGLRVLGTVWNSSLFPERAPQGHVLLTSFVGGATDPQAAALPHSELVPLVNREIAPVLGIRRAPSFSNVMAYPRALPQYTLGHSERRAAIETVRAAFSNLWLVGNYLHGPSIGACIDQGAGVAQEILSRLHS
jgi:protoporphyrinogen/coproporphyrinogen III oxidase